MKQSMYQYEKDQHDQQMRNDIEKQFTHSDSILGNLSDKTPDDINYKLQVHLVESNIQRRI